MGILNKLLFNTASTPWTNLKAPQKRVDTYDYTQFGSTWTYATYERDSFVSPQKEPKPPASINSIDKKFLSALVRTMPGLSAKPSSQKLDMWQYVLSSGRHVPDDIMEMVSACLPESDVSEKLVALSRMSPAGQESALQKMAGSVASLNKPESSTWIEYLTDISNPVSVCELFGSSGKDILFASLLSERTPLSLAHVMQQQVNVLGFDYKPEAWNLVSGPSSSLTYDSVWTRQVSAAYGLSVDETLRQKSANTFVVSGTRVGDGDLPSYVYTMKLKAVERPKSSLKTLYGYPRTRNVVFDVSITPLSPSWQGSGCCLGGSTKYIK